MPSRRSFLTSLAATIVGAPAHVRPPQDLALSLGFLGPDESPAARGVRMGAEEAERAAAMLGRRVSLAMGSDARRLLDERYVHVLVGGESTPECEALARLADERDVLWLDTGCADDALRGAGCRRRVFHVAPSAAMLRDAAAGGESRVVAWHASLERFGAEQLNARFRARFGAEMDAAAWLGWVAVKIAWEASARARATDSARLVSYLEREATRFDGHKGRPLSFRSWDHQLRQPLYLVRGAAGAETVTEVPPAQSGEESAASLDRIGAGRETTACRWGAP